MRHGSGDCRRCAQTRLLEFRVAEAQVDIVWDSPWNQEMITEEGKNGTRVNLNKRWCTFLRAHFVMKLLINTRVARY